MRAIIATNLKGFVLAHRNSPFRILLGHNVGDHIRNEKLGAMEYRSSGIMRLKNRPVLRYPLLQHSNPLLCLIFPDPHANMRAPEASPDNSRMEKRVATHCRPRSEPRRKRAQKRATC